MMKDHTKARSIQEVSWYEIVRQLKYKSEWNDRKFVQVDRWFPSSKTCYDCGYIHQSLKQGDREWDCPICNVHHNRDHNASLNILKQGLCGLGIKSHPKQKRGEALRMVCEQSQRVIKSTNHETRNQLSAVGNPLPLGGG